MSRRPARFTEAEIRRVIAAYEKEGKKMAVEISPDGTIRFVEAEQKKNQPIEAGKRLVF